MFTENILTYGIHPSEIVIFIIFLWGAYLFASISRDTAKSFFGEGYMFWVLGVTLICLQQFFDMFDNVPGFRFFNYLEHAAFLLGSAMITYSIYKCYNRCKTAGELVE
ncbi:MAG: hypothetical protein JW778_03920 [Candidatus Altiarchaeota archaeon]|nr:hypothetical protein [Candidatus Altiarchaeota archaeon]